ncbi:MAG: SagB/ThcOx family dehydrogenase [Alphaproteobacteria bacterium]|nr:MAG: SagB/ThcOx family dehydrogenase [Alphaproteobacteria bacterium]
MGALRTRRGRGAGPAILSARLVRQVSLAADSKGEIAARFDGHSVVLGKFSAGTADRAQVLRTGLPLDSLRSRGRGIEKELDFLVRRLARHGLLEYCLERAGTDQVVIEPQVPDYWPQAAQPGEADILALSRFAYMRRRGNDFVLESPRAGALFRICDATIAAAIATLSVPRPLKELTRQHGFAGLALVGLLLDSHILFKIDPARGRGPRWAEGDDELVLWDFHDLLFHARSSEGRHANPLGGIYAYANAMAPPPAVRPRWPGKKIDLRKIAHSPSLSRVAKLLRQRHSTRSFDDRRPISLAELARFLDGAARVQSKFTSPLGDGDPVVTYAARPYPSAGGSYGLELYLAVDKCKGLARDHYDAGAHALVSIGVRASELDVLLAGAKLAMGAAAVPQIVITVAARFSRTSWKYSSIAYALVLKDVGVLMQTLYLMATDLGLGGCAIGIANIDLFAKMTGIEFHIEGPVGQFALGRAASSRDPTSVPGRVGIG